MIRKAFALIFGVFLLTSVVAQNSLLGTWEDKEKGLKIVFSEQDNSMVARITRGAASFEFDGYSMQETNGQAQLSGNFADDKGNTYPFTADAANGRMTFRTGKAEYHLVKQGGGATPEPKDRNPFDENEAAPGPSKKDDGASPDAGGEYRHKSGIWTLGAPGAGWTREETPDGNTTQWTHANGGLVFVTIVPDLPFKSAEEFFQSALGPGLQQNGAQFLGQSPMDEPGAPSYCASFNRTRNSVAEFGTCLCSVINGKGVIFQMSVPQQHKDAMKPDMSRVFTSFRINK